VLSRLAGLARQSRLHGKFSARLACLAGIAMPGSQLAGLRFFHVIAKLIFIMFLRRAEIPANRASPPHVIGPLETEEEVRWFS